MSVHSYHPDSHTYGLADGCPRCAEHASHPFETLDLANLKALAARVSGDLPARSENERRAMETVRIVANQVERLRT